MFDNAANNLAMSIVLGEKLQYLDLNTYFKLLSSKENIYTIVNPYHMVKLLRNTLED